MSGSTVYFTIGNTDDKLSQAGWSAFIGAINSDLILARLNGALVHFAGASYPDAPWQNAQWCVFLPNDDVRDKLRARLQEHARNFLQDAISWAEVDRVEMLEPAPAGPW